jgi:hypothetical protein
MACEIKIVSVNGRRNATATNANQVVVTGTAQECESVRVMLYCDQSIEGFADVDGSGNWSVTFSSVSALKCQCGGNVSVAAACVGNPACNDEASFQLPCTVVSDCPFVNAIGVDIIVPNLPDPPCVTGPTTADVDFSAAGAPGPGNYAWDFGDGETFSGPNASIVTHQYSFPTAAPLKVTLTYTPTKIGCDPSPRVTVLLDVPLCTEKEDDDGQRGGGGEIEEPKPVTSPPPHLRPVRDPIPTERESAHDGCDALLVAAVGMILAGGLMAVGGVCGKALLLAYIGAGVIVLGMVLFFLWMAFCGRISSCSMMRTVHCMLFWLGVFTPVIVIGLAILSQDLACTAAIAGYWGLVGWLYAILGSAMSAAGCAKRCG